MKRYGHQKQLKTKTLLREKGGGEACENRRRARGDMSAALSFVDRGTCQLLCRQGDMSAVVYTGGYVCRSVLCRLGDMSAAVCFVDWGICQPRCRRGDKVRERAHTHSQIQEDEIRTGEALLPDYPRK